jgi:hypothetical protein
MLSYTKKEKLGYNSISYNEQIEACKYARAIG